VRNTFLIAKREYLQQIRGRAFRLSTILLPVGILAMLAAMYFIGRNAATGQRVAIAADNATLGNEIRRQLDEDKDSKITVEVVTMANQQDRDALLQKVRAKAIDGLLTVDRASSASPVVTYTSPSALDFRTSIRLKDALNRVLLKDRLSAAGISQSQTDGLLKEVEIENLHLNKEGNASKSTGMAPFTKAMMMAFLLTMPILLYGMDMARSIIEEKSSRIFEVMLSVAPAEDLLAGKLLGVGAVGLTQVAIWVAATALLTGSALAAPLLTGNMALHFSWAEGILFPVYYVLGFFLYSSLFSGLAATCESAQELQMFMPLAIGPVWISFGVLPYLLNNPGSVPAIVLSLFPPTAPFVMLPRMGLETVPLWQFAVSIALLMLSIWAVLWFSSRLYRVGILMYGKRATLPELYRWLRAS